MKNIIDEIHELIDLEYAERLTIPRRTLFLWWLLPVTLQTAAIFIWHGIFIVFSLFILFITAFILRPLCRVWKKYYSVWTLVILQALTLGTAILLKWRLYVYIF